MNWGLFFNDVLARVVGLIGLVAAAAWIVSGLSAFESGGTAAPGVAGAAVFSLAMAVMFLLPGTYQRMVARMRPRVLRGLFVLVCALWVVAAGYGLLSAGRALEAMVPVDLPALVWPVAAAALSAALLVLIFPMGLAWKSLQPEAEYTEIEREEDAEEDLEAVSGGVPVYRVKQAWAEHSATRAEAASAEDAARAWSLSRPVDEPPAFVAAPMAPGRRGTARVAAGRAADLLDVIAMLPLLAVIGGGLAALRFGTTVQTAELDAWLIANQPLALGVTLGLVGILPFLNMLLRGPTAKARARGLAARAIGPLIAAPVLVGASFVLGAFDGLPTLYNLVNDAPVQTLDYRVIAIGDSPPLSGCVRLQPAGAADSAAMICSLQAELVDGLVPGQLISATGPLSDLGHTFDEVALAD